MAVFLVADPFASDSDSATELHSTTELNSTTEFHLSGTACERLAELAGYLATRDHGVNDFLLDLGQGAAGISRGRRALADLARGGRNRIPGKGFKHPFDDGSIGQVRHFVGYMRAAMIGGTNLTRWIGEHLRQDPADSPDGRLGDEGIRFTQDLIAGRLELAEASAWLRTRLCRR